MSDRDDVMISSISSPKVRFTKGSEPLNNLQTSKFNSKKPKPVIKSSIPVNLRVDVLGENGKCVMKIKPKVPQRKVVKEPAQKSVTKKQPAPLIDLDGNEENFVQNSQDPDIMFLEEVKTPKATISFVSPKKVSNERNVTRVSNQVSRKSMPAVLLSHDLRKPQQNSINCTKKKLKEVIELECESRVIDLPQSNRKSLKNKVSRFVVIAKF